MAVYAPYKYLFTKDTEGQVQKFISREHSLQEYAAAIEQLKQMASEIGSLPVYVPMHVFLLDCTNLNKVRGFMQILKFAIEMSNRLINHIMHRSCCH